jgi:transposase
MRLTADHPKALATMRVDLDAIFVSLELSKSTWLVTSLSPGSEKMSRHSVVGGDILGLLTCFAHLRQRVQARGGSLIRWW